MTVSIWQRLGAFLYSGENLREDTLRLFAKAGGAWIAPVVIHDDAAGPWNVAHLDELRLRFADQGIQTWCWFVGRGGNPVKDAQLVGDMVNGHGLTGCILNLEAEYQYPTGDPNLMPLLVKELRKRQPTLPIAVSTNGLNSASIWNGRTLTPISSFYDLGIRVAPQAYSAYYSKDGHTRPDYVMQWLKDHEHTDGNFRDVDAPYQRSVPLSYVHFTVEASGIEGSDLADEIHWLRVAQRIAPGMIGYSLYTLERMPAGDWPLIAATRGSLYL